MLPESFNLDPSGKKKLWRCKFIDNLKYLVINDDAGNLEGLEQKRGRAYFFKTRPIFDAEKIVYKTRADMLVAAENTLKDISKDAQEIKRKYEDALAVWRESSDKTRKEELKAKKNALKVIFDEQKIRVSDLKLKLSLSSKNPFWATTSGRCFAAFVRCAWLGAGLARLGAATCPRADAGASS